MLAEDCRPGTHSLLPQRPAVREGRRQCGHIKLRLLGRKVGRAVALLRAYRLLRLYLKKRLRRLLVAMVRRVPEHARDGVAIVIERKGRRADRAVAILVVGIVQRRAAYASRHAYHPPSQDHRIQQSTLRSHQQRHAAVVRRVTQEVGWRVRVLQSGHRAADFPAHRLQQHGIRLRLGYDNDGQDKDKAADNRQTLSPKWAAERTTLLEATGPGYIGKASDKGSRRRAGIHTLGPQSLNVSADRSLARGDCVQPNIKLAQCLLALATMTLGTIAYLLGERRQQVESDIRRLEVLCFRVRNVVRERAVRRGSSGSPRLQTWH